MWWTNWLSRNLALTAVVVETARDYSNANCVIMHPPRTIRLHKRALPFTWPLLLGSLSQRLDDPQDQLACMR